MSEGNEGYIAFTNSQYDWLTRQAGSLSKREMAVLLAIIRFTFGFRRKEARLSGTYIAEATGIRSTHVPATLKKLSDKGIIVVKHRAQKNTNTIRFDWVEVMKLDTPKSGVLDTPKTGVSIHPKREERYSRNSNKDTPEMGDKTVKKTIKKYNKENTEPEEETKLQKKNSEPVF